MNSLYRKRAVVLFMAILLLSTSAYVVKLGVDVVEYYDEVFTGTVVRVSSWNNDGAKLVTVDVLDQDKLKLQVKISRSQYQRGEIIGQKIEYNRTDKRKYGGEKGSLLTIFMIMTLVCCMLGLHFIYLFILTLTDRK